MLVLPIKKKWFDMIKSGEKKEEYREIKPYWTKRLSKNLPMWETGFVKFRNGYGNTRPTITCKVLMSKRQGKEEWGAEPDKEYYVLEILEILEVENFDNPNPQKVKEAMTVAALPVIKESTSIDNLQEEITKAINKQIGINIDIDIGIDIGKSTSRSGQARIMEFGG